MKNSKFILDNLPRYKHTLLLNFIFTILASIFALLGTYTFSFIIDSIIDSTSISNQISLYITNLLGGVVYLRNHLYIPALFLALVYLIRGLFFLFRYLTQTIVSEQLSKNIRNKLFEKVSYLPYSYLKNANTGDLLQRCSSDIDVVKTLFQGQIQEVVFIVFYIFVAYVILMKTNIKLGSISFCFALAIFCISFIFQRITMKKWLKADEIEGELTSYVNESVSNIRVVKAFNREVFAFNKFKALSKKYTTALNKNMEVIGVYWALTSCLGQVSMLIILLLAVGFLKSGELTVGEFVMFASYQSVMVLRTRQLGRILNEVGKVKVSIKRINEVLDNSSEDLNTGDNLKEIGDIEFNNISFKYPDSDRYVLKDVSFKVNKGETLVIIGPTGSGKSSLVELIDRLYEPNNGNITINGQDISKINKKSLRENIGIILQDTFLFSRSIKENINIKEKYNQDKIEKFSIIACLDSTINKFKDKYDTLIGEKGVTLSGGQRQRVVIARTLIDEKPIIIFDDSLSAVDYSTDYQIRENIKKLDKNITKIIITSRASCCQDGDHILVIDDNTVKEYGTHEELLKNNGFYSRIYYLQNDYKEAL